MGYILRYIPQLNRYEINRIVGNRYDKKKLTKEVYQLSTCMWICKQKEPLIAFVKTYKEEQRNKHLEAVKKIDSRELVIN